MGNTPAPITLKRGNRNLGELSSKPRVKGGKLIAPKNILVSRDHELVIRNPGQGLTTHVFRNGAGWDVMEVHYGAEVATYRLYEDKLVYSDGPPHPDNLQLGVRTGASSGVEER